MSCPDYEQNILHHSYLLVLLRGVGPAKPRPLQKAFDKVRLVNNVKITDNNGVLRDIWIRYVHDYPVENNDWGDFQTHRRVIGLVTIGKFETQSELNELCRQHESLKVRYGSTLYESRAIFFGSSLKQKRTASCTASTSPSSSSPPLITTINHVNNSAKKNVERNSDNSFLRDEFTTPSNFKAQAVFYNESDPCVDLEIHINDFINALFWILESKRLERSKQKPEKCHLLTAPFEKREVVGLDRESRNSKKRVTGRMLKNLADLSLQAGLIEDALSLYHNACETLKSTMDFLWEGAAEEGLCAASALLLYPHLRGQEALHRNASLQETSPLKANIPEKWRINNLATHINVHSRYSLPAPPQHSAFSRSMASILTTSTLSQISPSNSSSTTSSSSTTTSINSTLPAAGHQGHRNQQTELPGNILKAEEISVYFHKAIINYSKYSMAAIVEIETSFKAARISIEQNRPLDVAMVLQNILCINHNLDQLQCISMFKMMSGLYQQIGYIRKASFFQRLAALEYVHNHPNQQQQQQQQHNDIWIQMYRYILASFPGYMLSLDPIEVLQYNSGWPTIQINLIQNLILAAKKSGHLTLAIRHMTFQLQTQWHHMDESDQKELAVKLKSLSEQCEGSPIPLVLEDGIVIPPANLTDIPYCLEMIVKDYPPPAKPQLLKVDKNENGPFLFTPLQFNSLDRRDKEKDKHKISFYWLQNNMAKVQIRLRNPLPFELTINDIRLLTNGVVFKSVPQTVTLSPLQQTSCITLCGTPMEVGELEIQGYSTHTLGVKSNCRLKHMKNRKFPPHYLISVIPELPYITLKTSLPQTATFCNTTHTDNQFVITSASLTLYSGESSSFVITIINDTIIPIEHLEINITSNVETEIQNRIFNIDFNDIQTKLPIAAKGSIDILVYIFAETDFIYPIHIEKSSKTTAYTDYYQQQKYQYQQQQQLGSQSYVMNHHGCNNLSIAAISSHHHQSHYHNQQQKYADANYSSFRSTMSSPLSPTVATTTASIKSVQMQKCSGAASTVGMFTSSNVIPLEKMSSPVQQLEAQFRLKYSGGNAMLDGYCRQCSLSIHLDFLPSVAITNWDVLPAEVPSQFYLVVDLHNMTGQEMSLNYTSNKNILIEAKESCRVPIPIDRVTLEEVSNAKAAEMAENLEKELCFRSNENDAVSKLCSKHIAERVKIKWLLMGTNNHGIASLRGITLTPAMMDLCTVSPLQWDISFKHQPVQPQSEVVCIAGESTPMAITISNKSLQSLRNLQLTIKFYQDYLNGTENHNLDTRVAISGPNRFCIPILKRGESMHHECTILFLTPGRFKTNIQCFAKSFKTLKRVNDSTTICNRNTSPDIDHHYNLNMQQQQSSYCSYPEAEEQDHTWKVVPLIEVIVIESQ